MAVLTMKASALAMPPLKVIVTGAIAMSPLTKMGTSLMTAPAPTRARQMSTMLGIGDADTSEFDADDVDHVSVSIISSMNERAMTVDSDAKDRRRGG